MYFSENCPVCDALLQKKYWGNLVDFTCDRQISFNNHMEHHSVTLTYDESGIEGLLDICYEFQGWDQKPLLNYYCASTFPKKYCIWKTIRTNYVELPFANPPKTYKELEDKWVVCELFR